MPSRRRRSTLRDRALRLAAYSARTRARASPVGGSCSRRPVSCPSASCASWAQTTSSNRGLIGSTTKSSAPVMRTVRWPSALCRLTRAMPAGKDLRQKQVVEQLRGVLAEQLLGRALVAAVEAAQEVPAVAAVEREQTRRLAEDPRGHPGPVGEWQVTRREPCVGLDDVRGHESVLEVECGEMAIRREDRPRRTVAPPFHRRARTRSSGPVRARPPKGGGSRARSGPSR